MDPIRESAPYRLLSGSLIATGLGLYTGTVLQGIQRLDPYAQHTKLTGSWLRGSLLFSGLFFGVHELVNWYLK